MPFSSSFITSDNYPEIRDRLGNADESLVPDSTIESVSYLPYAEAQIKKQVPDWEDLVTDEVMAIWFSVATICLAAYLLVPKVQSLVKSETIIDYAYTNLNPAEWQAKADAIRQEGINAIGQILYPNGWNAPTMFAVSGPSQVQSDPPVSLLFPVYVLDPPTY